jgi:hypothetical protein
MLNALAQTPAARAAIAQACHSLRCAFAKWKHVKMVKYGLGCKIPKEFTMGYLGPI